jgi:hypothetical protein
MDARDMTRAMKSCYAVGIGASLLVGATMVALIANPVLGAQHPWLFKLLGVVLLLCVVISLLPLRDAFRHIGLHFAVFGPMFIGLTLGSLDVGSRAWGAAFFQRTYDWSPARYGIVSGVVSIPCMLAGLYLGAKWAEWFQQRGDPAGAYRVILYTRLISIPFAILQPLMPTPELAIACAAVAYLTLGMTGPMLNAAMLAVTPNAFRGQIMTLYLFIYTVVGVGMGPWVTGLTTDYVFTSPNDLRWSIVLLHAVFLPISLGVTWLGLKAFRTEVTRLNQIDRQAA